MIAHRAADTDVKFSSCQTADYTAYEYELLAAPVRAGPAELLA